MNDMFCDGAARQYGYVNRMVQLHGLLQDEQSKELFWARLRFEAEKNMDHAAKFTEIADQYQENSVRRVTWREEFANASASGKKIILYGAGGCGQIFADYIFSSQADFYGFCDEEKHGQIVCGKPVLSPEELTADPGAFAVGITSERCHAEMMQFLQENGFPASSILHCFDSHEGVDYFEFPELFKKGTAFVDAGSFNGADSIYFSKWCGGAYSKIYAFEPDKANYRRCQRSFESAELPNVVLLQSALSHASGEAMFADSSTAGSYLVSTGQVTQTRSIPAAESTMVATCALDDLVDVEVGMIKMDIEGAEFDALHGAKATIQRDKPLLAICIYHRQGDMLAIMDYLHEIVPEYRFWIRHHGCLNMETLLYASI